MCPLSSWPQVFGQGHPTCHKYGDAASQAMYARREHRKWRPPYQATSAIIKQFRCTQFLLLAVVSYWDSFESLVSNLQFSPCLMQMDTAVLGRPLGPFRILKQSQLQHRLSHWYLTPGMAPLHLSSRSPSHRHYNLCWSEWRAWRVCSLLYLVLATILPTHLLALWLIQWQPSQGI